MRGELNNPSTLSRIEAMVVLRTAMVPTRKRGFPTMAQALTHSDATKEQIEATTRVARLVVALQSRITDPSAVHPEAMLARIEQDLRTTIAMIDR